MGRIFNPFFTTRDGALGAGLGLPLAADVARRGGGDLTVETEFGAYTEFTFTLPLELPPSLGGSPSGGGDDPGMGMAAPGP